MSKECLFLNLENMDYGRCLEIQKKLVEARSQDRIHDILILVEHPPVITLGRKSKEDEEVLNKEKIEREGIKMYRIERGGKSTCHSLGQLVGYPIIKLRKKEGFIDYISRLEEMLREVVKSYGIKNKHVNGYRGILVRENGEMKKIGAIGIFVKDNVSMHGFSLNVNNDLKYFSYILPCGLKNIEISSISSILSKEVDMNEVRRRVVGSFSKIFDYTIREIKLEDLKEYF